MKKHVASRILVGAGLATALAACSTTPDRIESLENARTLVSQVEASPRAGVAASNVAEARKALATANRLAESRGDRDDIEFQATIASLNAQIANEKILTAQAREEIEKGTAERQAVLLQSREREAQARAAEAERRAQEAREATLRAQTLEQELADLKAKKTDRGVVLTLGDVLFETGRANLQPGAYSTIDRLANALKEAPGRTVLIEGHTDSVGSTEFNQRLSENRAQSVERALLERGVAANQIRTVGKGESTPVASNDTASGRQQNRRVEMIFQEDRARVAVDE
jgi:outer membrane protein OmpA-like peptidoglycan-associated protein